jgi:hypothetical protein
MPNIKREEFQLCITGKDEKDGERHEEDLVECDHPEDVPGLELHEADQEPGAPPRVLTCRIKTENKFKCNNWGGESL